jgi:hypothetical protein
MDNGKKCIGIFLDIAKTVTKIQFHIKYCYES